MGLLDAFRKDEVVGTKVLVCALDTKFEDLRKTDERIYRCSYPNTTSLAAASIADFRRALSEKFDVVHLFADVDAQGAISDSAGGRMSGGDLLQACVDSGLKVLWIASDNLADRYNTGFKTKGMKLNVILTERRLGPSCSLFIDGLLSKLSAGESFSKAWNLVSKPQGKSVQPDVPETITSLGRSAVVLKK